MAPMSITFLGTSSGGGPSDTRNCSSLIADVLGNGNLWMVDCAEGTLRQFSLQPAYGQDRIKVSRVNKIFITHMHADHTMGLITVLRNVLGMPQPSCAVDKPPKLNIYGPAGLRTFIRSILKMTITRTGERYAVHELLSDEDPVTTCTPADVLHSSECPGNDIRANVDGLWREIISEGTLEVDAGPISHRDPCIGYVIREAAPLSRKIVILGDTYDPSPILPLCLSPPPSLLVHEATDAYIPRDIDPSSKRVRETVYAKCIQRGHSTPDIAGQFAKRCEARMLVLNHIGSRFPAPGGGRGGQGSREIRIVVIKEIERQASKAWGMGHAVVAADYMRISVAALRAESEEGGFASNVSRPAVGRSDRGEDTNTRRSGGVSGSPEHNQRWRRGGGHRPEKRRRDENS